MLAGKNQGNKFRKPGQTTSGPSNQVCEECGYKNHKTEECYIIVGYPTNFKSKKKNGEFKPYANSTTAEGGSRETSSAQQRTGGLFTPQQYQEALKRMNEGGTVKCVSNMEGTLQWHGNGDW